MNDWIGAVFYRGTYPGRMGYAELRYYAEWSKLIADEELAAVERARGE